MRSRLLFPMFLALTLGATGCSEDNPAGPSIEHEDYEGVLLRLPGSADGEFLYRVYRSEDPSGTVTVEAGSTITGIEVWFLDENGDPARPEDDHDHEEHAGEEHADEHDHEDEEFVLGIVGPDTAVATLVPTTGAEWSVDLSGVSAGSTEVQFQVLHGDHDDFTSLPVTVTVTAPAAR